MGVTGIWEHMAKFADNVQLESIRHKTLSIDGHIWLYESLRGCKSHGRSAASYLVTFFNRCQRLMEYNVELIVVFDSIKIDTPSSSTTMVDSSSWNVRKRKRSWTGLPSGTHVENMDKALNVQSMLRHLGVRCIIGEGDGEAQCAQLEMAGITQGCITSDFDYFLFGGTNLYKVVFDNGGRTVSDSIMHLSMEKLDSEHHLSRNRLIALAMLLGCDYYEKGVGRVGIVTALEILSEFTEPAPGGVDDHPVSILDRFSAYYRREVPERSEDSPTKRKIRRKLIDLPEGFPNTEILTEAVGIYLLPKVHKHDSFSLPTKPPVNMELVKDILSKECGWNERRLTQELEGSKRRQAKIMREVTQTKMTAFFKGSRRILSSDDSQSKEDTSCSRREWAALHNLKRKSQTQAEQTSEANSSTSTSISGTMTTASHSKTPQATVKRRSEKQFIGTEASTAIRPATALLEADVASESSSVQIIE